MPKAIDSNTASQCATVGEHSLHVCALIITFNPDQHLLEALITQCRSNHCPVVVVDNASGNTADWLHAVSVADVDCIWLPENQGLARAINVGLARLAANGYSFALLLDQDSQLSLGYCDCMTQAWHEARQLGGDRVAALGPRLVHPDSGRRIPFKLFSRLIGRSDRRVNGSDHLYQAEFLITSGTWMPLASIERYGGMREDYFIDNVDLEWCFRVGAAGGRLMGTDRAELYHRIGERHAHPLVRSGRIALHRPERTYFSTRNRLHLYRQAHAPLGWILRDIPRFFLKTIGLLLVSGQRRAYAHALTRGWRDTSRLP